MSRVQRSDSKHMRTSSRTKSSSGKRQMAGFTLLELTAVIFIIVILVSLLSAALNRTKAKAQQMTCLSNNLKELQLAWMMYVEDNDQQLPLNRSADVQPDDLSLGRRDSTNSWVAGSPKEDLTTDNIQAGTLYPFIKSPQLYRCPLDRSRVVGSKELRTRSYSMNSYLNGDGEGVDPHVKTKLSELINPLPDRIFVFIEEHELSIWDSSFIVLPREQFQLTGGSWNSTPADRHQRGCDLTFADGHVEYWKWFWPKSVNLANHLATNARELTDLHRLQAGVPKP